MMASFLSLFQSKKPVIGMIHLPALPGTSAGRSARFTDLSKFVLNELEVLQQGGVDGAIIENFWDLPYLPGQVPPVTVAAIASLAGLVVSKASIPIGINVLYNDYQAELAIARSVGAAFIRAEVFVDTAISETGLIQASAAFIIRERAALDAEDVCILADIQGKNTTPMWQRPLTDSAVDAEKRGLADAIVVTGLGTGKPVSAEDLKIVKNVVSIPLLAGSGVNPKTAADLLAICDAAIIGSYFKHGGNIQAPTDHERVRELMKVVHMSF